MKETKLIIKDIIAKHGDAPMFFKRNLVKEYLQVLVLDYIYSHPKYASLVFYGGSSLVHCYGLPRLSEDLDFVDVKKEIDLEIFAKDLEKFFTVKTDLSVSAKVQKFRIYLRFPILKELGMVSDNNSESDLLFLKVEIFKGFDFCAAYETETKPIFRFNRSILVKTFDLSTLMATKIRAVLNRSWEKKDKAGETIITVKGRDYFDLMWYLEKGIKPNLGCIENNASIAELKKNILAIVEKIDERSITLDLENFINDQNFVKNLGKNIKDILTRQIKAM
ncbi:MAG: nucleotidyl transferase AbiEii/AbiGii toxin family protein [Candidatus Paceibacterota bacterium]|jgi:predicted nucleotidyltransferase component of viral defense system